MKKLFLTLSLLLVLILALVACDSGNGGDKTPGGDNTPHTHSYGEWETTKEASCLETGTKVRRCACLEKETETIPALGHTEGEWIIDESATCAKTGTKHYICTVCSVSVSATIPMDDIDHSFGEWVIDVVDTCMQSGTRHHICTVCNKSVSESYSDANAHNYSTTWMSDNTHHWHKCQNSGCTSVVDKTTHTFGEWIVDTAATCVSTGTRHHVCTVCNKSVSESYSDANAHNYSTTWTSDNTNHWHKCQNSGCTSVVDKTTHTFGEWIVDTAATCVSTGTRHHVCTVCNKSVSESYSDANAHNYSTTWTSDNTNHWHVCQNNGCTSVSGNAPHNMVNEWCRVCKYTTLYTRYENYIYFGEYPQTLKAESVTVDTTTDSRGYYLGSDGFYYAKVTADPRRSNYTFSSGASVTEGNVYYFKVEPIRWRILSENGDTALILCDSIIANKAFDESRDNTYANSTVRAWLNAEFYNTAFNALQKELIRTVRVENSGCEDTVDKVFLLSTEEVTEHKYGFLSSTSNNDTARQMTVSDYARATGASMSTLRNCYGIGWWWLRTPQGDSDEADEVTHYGWVGFASNNDVNNSFFGIVPALQVRLASFAAFKPTYKVNDDGVSCTIIGIGMCTDADIVIPATIDGYKVTHIGEYAFYNLTSLESVIIPEGVTSIGEYAFKNCIRLEYVTFADNSQLTSIGSAAFEYCSSLRDISFGFTKLMEIDYRAFHGCSSLYDIALPDSVTSIGYYAFFDCGNLRSINIPSSVRSIGEYAFKNCTNLKTISYDGDRFQWDRITAYGWNEGIPYVVVSCTSGNSSIFYD